MNGKRAKLVERTMKRERSSDMAIQECDCCGEVRPGSSCTSSDGIEGFVCYLCRRDELDPYGELDDMDWDGMNADIPGIFKR